MSSEPHGLTFDVFISHARADAATAEQVAGALRAAGFRVFVDMTALAAGASFAEQLSRAIQGSRFVLALLSRSYVQSRWARQELGLAMEQELRMPAGAVKVVAVRLDDCDLPLLIRDKHAVDLRDPARAAQELARLVDDLRQLSTPAPARGHGTVAEMPGQRQERLDGASAAALLTRLTEAVHAFAGQASPPPAAVPEAAGPRTCFVVMPFGREDLTVVYEDFVQPVLTSRCRLTCVRGDDLFGSNVIMDDIRSSIARAHLVVADLTGRNANVFYEVGIAHALDVPVLLLAQSMDDVPFDLRHRRVLVYDYSPRGCRKLEATLPQHVETMLREPTA
jgi:hypothetical protein